MDDAWDALRERRSVLVLCAVVRAQDVQLQRVHSGRHAPMVDEFVCVCVCSSGWCVLLRVPTVL